MTSHSVVFLVNIMISVESYNFPVQNAPVLCSWYNTMVDCSFFYTATGYYGANEFSGGMRNHLYTINSQMYPQTYFPRVIPTERKPQMFRYPPPRDSNLQNIHTRQNLPHPYAYPIQSYNLHTPKRKMNEAPKTPLIHRVTDIFTPDFKRKQPIMLHLSTASLNTSILTNSFDANDITTNMSREATTPTIRIPLEPTKDSNVTLYESFMTSLDALERKFYLATFMKLSTVSPADRRENGISFIQSGLFLYFHLISLLGEVEPDVQSEITECIGRDYTETEKIRLIRQVFHSLPSSSDELKFLWSSRLVLAPSRRVSQDFMSGVADALHLQVDHFNGTETPSDATQKLNSMVETDSQGSMHNTFDEEELADGICAALLSVTYVRGRWRTSPTLLNAPKPFYDDEGAPQRNVRMIKLNDVMKYTALEEWNAQALEVFYSTPGLSLLIIVPQGRSLRSLASHVAATSIHDIIGKMKTMRVAATLPLYTLRMTLLLPSKLLDINITQLVNTTNCNEGSGLKLSHAIQRIMFWAEAGRNAFKEDGIEWDPPPELEVIVDRPYIFFVRWHNITLLNGNFVL